MTDFQVVPPHMVDQFAVRAVDLGFTPQTFAVIAAAFNGFARGLQRTAEQDPGRTLTLAEVAEFMRKAGDSFTNLSTTMKGGQ